MTTILEAAHELHGGDETPRPMDCPVCEADPHISSGPHGILGLTSPWARGAFRDLEERAAIERSIPPGYVIGVSGHAHGRSAVFVLWALGPGKDAAGHPPELMRWPGRHDPVEAARAMAERLREMAA